MQGELAAMRDEYTRAGLSEDDAGHDPLELFTRWFQEARDTAVLEPNAMVLATSGAGGPSSRTVLLKGFGSRGFTFFTNRESRKGHELAVAPECSLLFPWYPLQRQVRVEGIATPLSRAEDETYFASRPREAQLGAWASAQSSVVESRADLESAYADAEQRFEGGDVPCPEFWGGYLVTPDVFEFWQGRPNRLHDRLLYRREGEIWARVRLAP